MEDASLETDRTEEKGYSTTDPFEMNVRHLRALALVYEHRNLSVAANLVHLSQPALTQGIAKLERQFGEKLFERRSDGMITTPAGEVVAERVVAAIECLNLTVRTSMRTASHVAQLITMTQLRALLALSATGSYAAAARTSNQSQTALHRAVNDLEHVLGKPLVQRRGRAAQLNATGVQLARGARLSINELRAAISELGTDPSGELITVGASPLSRPYLVPEAIARMVDEEVATNFRVMEGGFNDFLEPLRDGFMDLAVSAIREHQQPELTCTPLYQDQLIVVAGAKHPLASVANPSHKDLCSFPWIVGPDGSPVREQWERFFGKDAKLKPVESGSTMVVTRILTRGNFLTLLSPSQISLMSRSGLVTQIGPALPDTSRPVGVITRRGWRPTKAQKRFIELLQEISRGEFGTDY